MQLNQIIHGDALAELKQLPADSFAAIITSPPCNLDDMNPPCFPQSRGVIVPRHMPVEYPRWGFTDNLPPGAYIGYHRKVMAELLRVVQPAGLIWYIHRRPAVFNPDGGPVLVTEVMNGWPVRTEIIWHNGPGLPDCRDWLGRYYYPDPRYETIFLLARDESAVLNPAIAKLGDVWQIPNEILNWPPTPFPVELAARCIEATLCSGPVLDPFMGAGATGLAAQAAGRDWLGLVQSAQAYAVATQRLSLPAESVIS